MCAAVRELIELGRAEAVKRGVSAQTEPAEALPGIPGDRVELQQVILNLILNAVKSAKDFGSRTGGREHGENHC
jgi:signal transduction histidine kinase